MRIGLVCPMLSFVGGVQRHVLMLGKALAQRDVEVVYFSPAPQNSPGLPTPHVQLGNAVVLPNFNGSWNDYSVTTQSKDELSSLIMEHGIDILHFHSLIVPFASWQFLEASPVTNIATLHSGWEKNSPVEGVIPVMEFLVKNLKQKLTQTIAVSQTALNCERYFADKNTIIIPNPIDIAAYRQPKARPAGLASNRCNIIFVGRLDKRKGFIELLHAIKELPQSVREAVLVHVIGAGPLETIGKTYIAEAELSQTVCLLGRLSESEKIAYLQHGDIFVAPSLAGESFGIVLTEAMAAGLPIICGNNAGYAETMREYPNQEFILDPSKPRLFARAIQKMVADADLRVKLAVWGSVEVKQYDINRIVELHLALYRRLLTRRA